MSDILVSLDRIVSNPYQTRQPHDGDDAHVAVLAADIQQRGLLQVPLGRLVEADGRPCNMAMLAPAEMDQLAAHGRAYIQLAFGHHRLAAYRLLASADPERWDRMPVRIADLDDQAMALAAWSENAARKDLSPLEAAQALQRFGTDFGWTQDQVAAHVGLARATVANKLRLLRLPEKLQKKLHAGELSERQALAVLPVYELPPAAQERLEEKRQANDWSIQRLDEVLAHPDKKSSSDVRSMIRDAVRSVTRPLATASENEWGRASFAVDREIAGVAAPACLECPNRLQETRCADGACYDQKQEAFERQEIAFAVAATGLPAITNAELHQMVPGTKKYLEAGDRQGLQQALDGHCPHLRLHYDRDEPRQWQLRVPDYPHVGYVCVRGGDTATTCECVDGDAAKRAAKEKAAEERRQKKAAALREATVKELTQALRAPDVGAWRAVLWTLRSYSYSSGGSTDKVAGMDLPTVLENIARAVLKSAVRWDYPGKDGVAAELAAWREKVGWVAVVVAPESAATAAAAEEATQE